MARSWGTCSVYTLCSRIPFTRSMQLPGRLICHAFAQAGKNTTSRKTICMHEKSKTRTRRVLYYIYRTRPISLVISAIVILRLRHLFGYLQHLAYSSVSLPSLLCCPSTSTTALYSTAQHSVAAHQYHSALFLFTSSLISFARQDADRRI